MNLSVQGMHFIVIVLLVDIVLGELVMHGR